MSGSYITLSQLQNQIKQSIERNITAQWVSCDITDMKVNHSGHCYLELTEKREGSGAIPKAKATAIIWRNTYTMVDKMFVRETGSSLQAGIKALIYVEVNYHELYGLSLVVRDIDPTYTLGEGERIKRETVAALTKDGVIDMNRQLILPSVIDRVAIISSLTAAGYDDFINHLDNNIYGYCFNHSLFSAIMQGEGAEESIIAALMEISQSADDFDAVVVIRGGGSQSDLSCFNSYLLCSYLAQFPLPIITGIGHNKDVSVADMVAHTSVKTPTAVANLIIDTSRLFEEKLEVLQQQLLSLLGLALEREYRTLDNLANDIGVATRARLNSEAIMNERLSQRLEYAYKGLFTAAEHKLSLLTSELESRNPLRIIEMGYSIATLNGKVIRSVSDVTKGDKLVTIFSDGELHSRVE